MICFSFFDKIGSKTPRGRPIEKNLRGIPNVLKSSYRLQNEYWYCRKKSKIPQLAQDFFAFFIRITKRVKKCFLKKYFFQRIIKNSIFKIPGPEHYVSHLIGHEGAGSILSELKAKGWCNNLMGGYSTSGRGFGSFDVMVDLTQDGFEHIDDIIKIIFQYINLLRKEGPKKWIFEEYCNLSEMQFRFKDKENPLSLVSNVVHSLQSYPLEEVLAAPYLISEWRPDLIENLWNKFRPENARVIIVGQKCEERAVDAEKWYGTKYVSEKIPMDILKDWATSDVNKNLHLPEPNVFIPTDFNLLAIDHDVQDYPVIIHDTSIIRVWFKQDIEFLKPKTLMNFDFSSPIVYSDPLNCNLTHLFVQLFKDHLNEYLYEADLAGLR